MSRDEEYMGYKIPVSRPNQQYNYVPLYNSFGRLTVTKIELWNLADLV